MRVVEEIREKKNRYRNFCCIYFYFWSGVAVQGIMRDKMKQTFCVYCLLLTISAETDRQSLRSCTCMGFNKVSMTDIWNHFLKSSVILKRCLRVPDMYECIYMSKVSQVVHVVRFITLFKTCVSYFCPMSYFIKNNKLIQRTTRSRLFNSTWPHNRRSFILLQIFSWRLPP